jgi:SAM-dependent methyltransferase
VTVHQVLHYLGDPAAAVAEAARLVADGGLLLIADFAPHDHEFLRENHQHRRLGFADAEIIPGSRPPAWSWTPTSPCRRLGRGADRQDLDGAPSSDPYRRKKRRMTLPPPAA